MANPLSHAYAPLVTDAGEDSDSPYHSVPSPAYPGGPPAPPSADRKASASFGPFRPAVAPTDTTVESQLAFYRDELNYVRQEHQKALDKLDEWKRYGNNRFGVGIGNRQSHLVLEVHIGFLVLVVLASLALKYW
ncbi:hypothetical protein JCM11491_004519 [Sporobolomyces phaffii]